jgi:hypothetical protein
MLIVVSTTIIENSIDKHDNSISRKHSAAPSPNAIDTLYEPTKLSQPKAGRTPPFHGCRAIEPFEGLSGISRNS